MIELLNDNMLADLTEAELIQVRALIDRYIKDNKTKVQTKVEHLFKSTIEKLQAEFNAYLKNNGIEHGYKISINIDSEEATKIKYTMVKKEIKIEEPKLAEEQEAKLTEQTIHIMGGLVPQLRPPTVAQITNAFQPSELDDIFREED